MRRLRRSRHQQVAEMNITAFMNLMVILIPFLLLTTVFSHLVVLELNLPTASKNQVNPDKLPLQLTIIVRHDRIDVSAFGQSKVTFNKRSQDYDLSGLRDLLKTVKIEFPEKTSASILMEPDIDYESLIGVMDIVRTVHVKSGEGWLQTELFPNISIGDAPLSTTQQTH